jgi:hypothetical protein
MVREKTLLIVDDEPRIRALFHNRIKESHCGQTYTAI